MGILDKIKGTEGFAFEREFLSNDELEFIRQLIKFQYVDRLNQAGPRYYHAHSLLWPKRERILSEAASRLIQSMTCFGKLKKEFGELSVTAEEELIPAGEMYWRLVRPNMLSDIGPLHADRWFWDAADQRIPDGRARVKVWLPIWTEPGLNGLELILGSHRMNLKYEVEMRDGKKKPVIVPGQHINPVLIPAAPGDAIIFHDELVHGGARNIGELTRVSMEFTILIDVEKLR